MKKSTERVKTFRKKNESLNRRRREIYVTNDEFDYIKRELRRIRENG